MRSTCLRRASSASGTPRSTTSTSRAGVTVEPWTGGGDIALDATLGALETHQYRIAAIADGRAAVQDEGSQLVAVALAVCVWVAVWLWRTRPGRLAQVSSGLLVGGAVSFVAYRVMLRIGRLPEDERVLRATQVLLEEVEPPEPASPPEYEILVRLLGDIRVEVIHEHTQRSFGQPALRI